jgi:hypothetical protein
MNGLTFLALPLPTVNNDDFPVYSFDLFVLSSKMTTIRTHAILIFARALNLI